jgi:four helix bundle protein
MNNISEGYERDNNKEFRNFLGYAKGSAGEVRSMLYIALDLNYISKDDFDKEFNNSINIITQISNFKKYLKNCFDKERFKTIKSLLLQIFAVSKF